MRFGLPVGFMKPFFQYYIELVHTVVSVSSVPVQLRLTATLMVGYIDAILLN